MAGEHRCRSSNRRWLPSRTRAPSTRPSAPRPASDATSGARRHADVRGLGVLNDRARDGMLGSLLHRCGQRDNRARGHAVERHDVDDLGRPAGERAGLVERHAPHASRTLEMRAAFDEHALARRARKRRDNRNRRGDHQRARTRDDQQDQRAVDPGLPRAITEQRRHDGDSHRQRNDGRGVDAREALDECLRRGALRLRLFDQMNDAGQRRIAPGSRDAHVERAAPVDRCRQTPRRPAPCRPAATRR